MLKTTALILSIGCGAGLARADEVLTFSHQGIARTATIHTPADLPAGPAPVVIGLYGHGESKSVTLAHAGLVRVYCNVHHEMFAYILVLDTPFFTHPQADGSFALGAVPAGPGVLTVWNPRGEVWRQHLDSPAAALAVELKLSRFAVPAHFNKFGKPYDKNAEPGY